MTEQWERLKEYLEKLLGEQQHNYSEESYGSWNTIIKIQMEMERLEKGGAE